MMNPKPPKINGLIKLHEENIPIRPMVSYIKAPIRNLFKKIIEPLIIYTKRHVLSEELLRTSYSSYDEDDIEQKGEITPKNDFYKTKAQLKSHETTFSGDGEQLVNLVKDKEESFHVFLTTPNYATTKCSRSRQKAINYKEQGIVKDLFGTEDKENKMKQMTIKKKGKSTIKKDQKKKTKKNDSSKQLQRIVIVKFQLQLISKAFYS
ncbi:hypothetical protein WA026_016543 [Henosepilachna vigintioctopunctata]|uniref:Uncharacterized protein n=1 Tax=Henosepilachna vigintioctopunctata TaxID=420089 RepID=A0AAW1V7S8_9CUCU